MRNWLANRKIGVRLQMATGITLVVFALLLVSVQVMESHRLYDARVSLLQSIDETAIGIAATYQMKKFWVT
jgi:hypothetical protein